MCLNSEEIKVLVKNEDPLNWAECKTGWVTLHDDEIDIVNQLLETFRKAKVEKLVD